MITAADEAVVHTSLLWSLRYVVEDIFHDLWAGNDAARTIVASSVSVGRADRVARFTASVSPFEPTRATNTSAPRAGRR